MRFLNNNSDDFWGIPCLFNHINDNDSEYENVRIVNYITFANRIRSQGLRLITVELVNQNQDFQIKPCYSDILIQVKQNTLLWQKECLLNMAITYLPKCCKYVCWLDSDILFLDSNWIDLARNKMKNANVIQLFKNINYLNSKISLDVISNPENDL